MAPCSSILGRKVAILGAAGGIGQPLSLLLKTSQYISDLHLYDVVKTEGLGVELSHIDTKCKVKSFCGPSQIAAALDNVKLILIPAGMPRKPGMLRNDLFQINADIIRDLIKEVAINAPKAWIGIVTNPINITVPIAAGFLKDAGVYSPDRLFGITTLDSVRANTMVAALKNLDPAQFKVPVLGGHSGETIVPIFSSLKMALSIEELEKLTGEVRDAGTKVVDAKGGTGSATLSMAYAAARFAQSALRAINGEAGIVECAYVESSVTPAPFFASPVALGRDGIVCHQGLGELSEFEDKQIKIAINMLMDEFCVAEAYLKKNICPTVG